MPCAAKAAPSGANAIMPNAMLAGKETTAKEIPPEMSPVTLEKRDDPDLLLIFCTPIQADVLIRAHAYLGSMVHGFAGNGACIFNIRYSYVTREPSFSTSDDAWRIFAGLNGNELTVTYPYEKLIAAAPHIKPINDHINNLLQ